MLFLLSLFPSLEIHDSLRPVNRAVETKSNTVNDMYNKILWDNDSNDNPSNTVVHKIRPVSRCNAYGNVCIAEKKHETTKVQRHGLK